MIRKKNIKTQTDLRFAGYLNQQNLNYKYEPYSSPTIPDYIFYKNGKSILVECEEIERIPLDSVRPGAGSLSMGQYISSLQGKIYVASKQLKPHSEKADYLIIILGKKSGFDLDLHFLYWAMYGDPVIRVPLYQKGKRQKPIFDMKVKGQLRKNDPITKQMYFPHSYISGIGLIKEFNGLSYYKSKLFNKHYTKSKSLRINTHHALNFFNKGWEKYKNEIPKIYSEDSSKIIYKIEVISNPFADRPVPKTIFDSEWDLIRIPKVMQS